MTRRQLLNGIKWIHRWTGLVTGIIVSIVCFTGSLWVFRQECQPLLEPYQRITPEAGSYLPPELLRERALAEMTTHEPDDTSFTLQSLTYRRRFETAVAVFHREQTDAIRTLHFNPYTGKLARYIEGHGLNSEVFMVIIRGHRWLWLPPAIGSPIVGGATLVFILICITGLIWWYPKKWNRRTAKKSFTVAWRSGFKRLNLDLHNVFGFYAAVLLIILAITGVVYSFQWFRQGYYGLLSGGKQFAYPTAQGTPTPIDGTNSHDAANRIYHNILAHYDSRVDRVMLLYPQKDADWFRVSINLNEQKWHTSRLLYFDPVTANEVSGAWEPPARVRTVGEQLFEKNLDIHVGSIGGLPTKILASLVSLVGASLPITGFIIWYNRKYGKKKRKCRGTSKRLGQPRRRMLHGS
ncbi:PepSY-associated TM helix domain-containing protein [Parapedobacter indicus]|uniref:PepSY-associated TM helix domain-containing protein n=1 Tax=Parapedobacter indicus TaxID=1477437 RepID=UPI000AA7ED32|nr:PepSY-associated TM helix domain-containing protein [Parapedobacter indicus]